MRILMKKCYYIFFVCMLFVSMPVATMAQITISNTDIDTAITNTQWLSIDDTLGGNFDLGTASSSAQTFDFSTINIAATADSEYQNYYLPSGHIGADSFPTATQCYEGTTTLAFPPYTITMTIAGYYSIETSGAYVLGLVMRQQVSPTPPPGFPFPADTTQFARWDPKDLAIPLPLTLGTSQTNTATLSNFDGEMEITTRTYTADGFGTLITPDGRTLQAIRLVVDEIELGIDGSDTTRQRTQEIMFIAQDLTRLSFQVDTNYSGGATTPLSYDYEKKIDVLAVREISNSVPDVFELSQNYPNPFNPMTTIRFMIQDAGYTSLKVYNMLGEEVATLVSRQMPVGTYEASFDASNLPSGMYMYKLSVGEFVQTRKMILAK
ncbi:MAG: T9SS type A sorting domain-containing protein [Bacteroidetes bacterium]|nr:MAG: T9SS type A sorting domain-containing protein [Bacteroidota bacterium]